MDNKVVIRWLDETDSTQEEVRRHILEYDNLSVVAAGFQTAGRGQRGNTWLSGKGENLTFSMLLRFGEDGFPSLTASRQFLITKAATLAIASFLDGKGVQCSIKWPNDIYVRDKKICGMLIENILSGNEVSLSVVGIGLNVNQKEFSPSLMNPTSMSLITGLDYDVKDELKELSGFLDEWFRRGLGTPREALSEEYERRLYRKDIFREYSMGPDGERFQGKIVGVNEEGRLLVVNNKGELKQFAFKEINYII